MNNHTSVIDLDINELAALLLLQGDSGTDAAISLIDDSLSSLGPIANLIVQNAMSFQDRTHEYKLPRNYTGDVLRNKIIADKVVRLGLDIMSDRSLFDPETGSFTNPIIETMAQVISNPQRVIHNFTMLSEYDRASFVSRHALRIGLETAESTVPQTPPNGISYPVTTYTATIISTERGGVIIAPNDFNSMLFDLQLIAPGSVGSFIKELVDVAENINDEVVARTIVYGVKIPGLTEINAAVFSDIEGNWSAAFAVPEDDISYVLLSEVTGDEAGAGIDVAVNNTDLLDASSSRGRVSLLNSEAAGEYLARLSDIPLARHSSVASNTVGD